MTVTVRVVMALEQQGQLGQITNLEVRRRAARAAAAPIAVEPRYPEPGGFGALDVVDLAVSDVKNLVGPHPQLVEGPLEHPPVRFVSAHCFGDEDELDGQCEVAGGDMLVIGIGNDGGAVAER